MCAATQGLASCNPVNESSEEGQAMGQLLIVSSEHDGPATDCRTSSELEDIREAWKTKQNSKLDQKCPFHSLQSGVRMGWYLRCMG